MDRDTIIDGLRMTMDLCVFDPSTGEEIDPHLLNDLDRATYDACKGALEIIEQLDTDSDTISRQAAIETVMECYDNAELFEVYEEKLRELPPAQPAPSQVAADIARIVENGKDMRVIEAAQPTPDQNGDLWITVPDIDKVTCIYVQESKSKFCRIFYEER